MKARRPGWLHARIVANARKAKLTICPCGSPVLAGLDDDRCAFTANADIRQLTPAGETATTVLLQRATFELAVHELWRRRDSEHGKPSRFPILPEHRCNDPVPSTWTKPPNPNLREDPDDPPF